MAQETRQTASVGKYRSIGDLRMYYEESGDPASDPLVLIHGGTANASMWASQLPFLASHFRVIAPDSRGHGRTNNPERKLSYRLMADDIAALIDELALDTPLVFGYSDGGQVALELAMRHPGASRAVIIAGAAFRLTESLRDAVASMRATLESPQFAGVLRSMHTWNPDPDYVSELIDQVVGMALTGLNYDPEDFQRITDPALIMLGDRDGIMDLGQAVDLFPLIVGAELAIVPNTTHMSALETPLFTAIALDFLLRHRRKLESGADANAPGVAH